MNINIPKPEQDQLTQHAIAAGYSDVTSYVTEYVKALAYQAPGDFEPLSPEVLEASLKTCDRSMAEIDRGEGMTVKQARRHSVEQLRED